MPRGLDLALQYPWLCQALGLALQSCWAPPKYGLGESTGLLPDPALGKGNGVEPAGPTVSPAKSAVMPCPAGGRVEARGVPSPFIPPPSWGGGLSCQPTSHPAVCREGKGLRAAEVAVVSSWSLLICFMISILPLSSATSALACKHWARRALDSAVSSALSFSDCNYSCKLACQVWSLSAAIHSIALCSFSFSAHRASSCPLVWD